MGLNRQKMFILKNGELQVSIVAHQSGYSGGMPARINSAGELARCYDDGTGYVGIFANYSTDLHGVKGDQSGNPGTYYFGPGIFTFELSTATSAYGVTTSETAYPYNENLTYTPGDGLGIVSGLWANAGYSTKRAVVIAAGTVSGGKTTSLTVQML